MDKSKVKIMVPTAADEDILYELVCELELGPLDREKFAQVYQYNIKDPNIYYIKLLYESEVIGFGSVHIQKLLHHCYTPVGEVQELIVTKKYQGLGLGTLLMDRLKDIAAENKCELLEVCCNRQREDSLKFYLRQGMDQSHYKFTLIM